MHVPTALIACGGHWTIFEAESRVALLLLSVCELPALSPVSASLLDNEAQWEAWEIDILSYRCSSGDG